MKYLTSLLESNIEDINYIKFSIFKIRCMVAMADNKDDLEKAGFNEDTCNVILNYLIKFKDNEIKVKFFIKL